jgi:rhodanese-related sulfurtransferase
VGAGIHRYAHDVSTPADTTDIGVEPAQVADWLAEDGGPQDGQQAGPHDGSQVGPRVSPQVIDVRESYEREAGHIAGTRHIQFAALTAAAATIEQGRPVVFYCRVGARSNVAAQAFRGAGYEAYSMNGGLLRWAQEGRPLVPADGRVADH